MTGSVEITLPDIGDYKDVPIVEINVAVGDDIVIDMPLLSIESDKATMEVPSPAAGKITKLMVGVGSRVSQGALLMILECRKEAVGIPIPNPQPAQIPPKEVSNYPVAAPKIQAERVVVPETPKDRVELELVAAHASPSVRALSRELGVSLGLVRPSGPKGRIVRDDVIAHVKQAVSSNRSAPSAAGSVSLDWPKVDFEKFGAIERLPLTRIQKLTGANLSRNWNMIPHVTNFDKADVTELEAFRKTINSEAETGTAKLTMVSLLIKAAALALQKYPRFNSSLDGDELILKRYVHVGFAVDTPNGLVVPAIRNCDRKGLIEIASEMRGLADKAIKGRLAADDMQGACFSVSSLGGIGGDGFTPIINAPEVAILGAGKVAIEAIWNGTEFRPRLMIPISLSWDHRVVNGVSAARFLGFIADILSDVRRCML